MKDFPEFIHLPLAKWIDVLVDWVTIQGEAIFDAIGAWLLVPLLALERFPPLAALVCGHFVDCGGSLAFTRWENLRLER